MIGHEEHDAIVDAWKARVFQVLDLVQWDEGIPGTADEVAIAPSCPWCGCARTEGHDRACKLGLLLADCK